MTPKAAGPIARSVVIAVFAFFVLIATTACSGGGDVSAGNDVSAGDEVSTGRSSGRLPFTEATADPASRPGSEIGFGIDGAGPDGQVESDSPRPLLQPGGPTVGTVQAPRADGIEFVYAEGSLGPVALGGTATDMATALGSAYNVEPEPFVREGFGPGYSVSRDGEVLFWAIEVDGVIGVIMSTNPKVGLDGGLRPKMAMSDAVALHGEPLFEFGPLGREFVMFDEMPEGVVVLASIGDFGGPVGAYDSADPQPGDQAEGYQPEGAQIKELWFTADS